jgi:hypothetical protein
MDTVGEFVRDVGNRGFPFPENPVLPSFRPIGYPREFADSISRVAGKFSPLSHGVISPEGSNPIRPTTERHSLPPSSATRRPIGDHLAAGLPRGEVRASHGSTVSRRRHATVSGRIGARRVSAA